MKNPLADPDKAFTAAAVVWFAAFSIGGALWTRSPWGLATGLVLAWFALVALYGLIGLIGLAAGLVRGHPGAGIGGPQLGAALALLLLLALVLGPRFLSGRALGITLGAAFALVAALSFSARNKL